MKSYSFQVDIYPAVIFEDNFLQSLRWSTSLEMVVLYRAGFREGQSGHLPRGLHKLRAPTVMNLGLLIKIGLICLT